MDTQTQWWVNLRHKLELYKFMSKNIERASKKTKNGEKNVT